MKKLENFDKFNEKFVAVGFGMPMASASWSTPARITYRDSAYDLAPIAGSIPDLSMGIAQQAHNYETNDNTQHTGDAYIDEAKGHINEAIDKAWSDKKLEAKESKKVNEDFVELMPNASRALLSAAKEYGKWYKNTLRNAPDPKYKEELEDYLGGYSSVSEAVKAAKRELLDLFLQELNREDGDKLDIHDLSNFPIASKRPKK
jgi:hypothetical protein